MTTYIIPREFSRTCHFCGDTFISKSSIAKFCKPTCKQKMYRWRKRLPFLYTETETHLDALSEYLKFPDSRPHTITLMKLIKQRVDELWLNAGVKVVR